jgi:glyoxylase-like metal-dependent hydrolase (beta-lactamase superfamily II)
MKWLRRLGYLILALAVIGAGAYYWLIVDASGPSEGDYAIDMAEVRTLAASLQGDKAAEIRVERISAFKMPFTAMIAGESWTETDVPVYSYQLAFAGKSILIDTAIDGVAAIAQKDPSFDGLAYARMQAAMITADDIVITHEHPDHIGGLVAHPALPMVLEHTQLTQEQVDHPEKMFGLKFPDNALKDYTPLAYDKYRVLAPGVVLIKAPGHTPGSQMVFVQLADGKEFLFLGDIAWRFENVERVRTRARLVSWWFLGEDRDAVLHELAELKRLRDAEPNLIMVPGHDVDKMNEILQSGAMASGFK